MKISATIQARMGSTRLPGKVLRRICGKPMLMFQIERIKQSMLIDEVIITTSDSRQDDPIEALAQKLGIPCFRGSENDVLGRVINTLKAFDIELHAEFMGDNPMPDPALVDTIIGFYLKHSDQYDYVTNGLKTTYPPGLEVSVYPAKILYNAEKYVTDESLREHVGIHIYQNNDRYRTHNIEAPPRYYRPDLYLEVDYPEDFEVISKLYEEFYPTNKAFSMAQVLEYLDKNPGLAGRNQNVERRWKKFRQE